MAEFIPAEKGLAVPPAHGGLVTLSHVPGVQAEGETAPLFREHKTPVCTKSARLFLRA